MRSYAVIVGVSTYLQRQIFSSLPGAARDAIWFERFLRGKGFIQREIESLIGPSATKAAILTAIAGAKRDARKDSIRLLIYFSGHGGTLRISPEISESVLFCYDTSIQNRLESSIRIDEFFQSIAQAGDAEEVYVFLDACHLTLDALAARIQILASRVRRANTFCCVLANDGGVSLEGFASPMGEFSSVLLASTLSVDASASPSIGALVTEVARRARQTGVTSPTAIFFGDPTRWPFSMSVPPPTEMPSDVARPQLVEAALTVLRREDHARVCITGASGTGKSSVLNQVVFRLGSCPVARFVREDLGAPQDVVTQRIVEAIIRVTPAGGEERSPASSLETALGDFSKHNAHAVLALDGGENLSTEAWVLLGQAIGNHGVNLLTTRHGAEIPGVSIESIEMQPMNRAELLALSGVMARNFHEDAIARAEATSGGFPLAFLQALDDDLAQPVPKSLENAMRSLQLSRGYCDQSLYCALINISKKDFERLEALGMLVGEKEVVRLHDAAVICAGDNDAALAAAVASYWQAELGGPHALVAALKILELAAGKDLRFSEGTVAAAIKRAEARATSPIIATAALVVAKNGDESAFIEAVDILSRRGAGELLSALLEPQERLEENFIQSDPRVSLAKARAAWWAGDYVACRMYAEPFLAAKAYSMAATLEIAIADFFEGRWSHAQKALEPLALPGSGELRNVGWAQLILGTCLGIRGLAGDRGRVLLRSAAEVLRASNDLAGAAIAKGNCGEVSWKRGDFETSELELASGLALARSLGMSINAVESQRNLVQLYMRWGGPSDPRLEPHVRELQILTLQQIGAMEMMQVANTMATLFLYRRDMEQAADWLAVARPLTAGNKEYDIYTLANDGILLALKKGEGAIKKLGSALQLCVAGQNLLALKQIRHDIIFCLGASQPKLTKELLHAVDQDMRSVENELSAGTVGR